MSQHCTVDTYLCLRAIRTEGAVYRNVALKQYLQNMQTSVSVFGKNKTGFCCYVSVICYSYPIFLSYKFIFFIFIFSCIGSSLLHAGFL